MKGIYGARVGVLLRLGAYRGGNCNNDLKVGAFYCNLNNTASNTNWNIGASVSYFTLAMLRKFLASWQKLTCSKRL